MWNYNNVLSGTEVLKRHDIRYVLLLNYDVIIRYVLLLYDVSIRYVFRVLSLCDFNSVPVFLTNIMLGSFDIGYN